MTKHATHASTASKKHEHEQDKQEHESPTIGRIVHYVASVTDAERASAARAHAGTVNAQPVLTGGHYAAIVVGVEGYGINARVLLDGPDDLYVDHVQYADEDETDEVGTPLTGRWHWPEQG